ncbi:MAG TPA: HEPN domain-containing protein [Sphingomicrobium sp.]|nr:HEPN domain-containing protein [Sphingomicrobium sp.]
MDPTIILSFLAESAKNLAVKSELDYLPEGKRRELQYVVKIIRDGFEFAIARRTMPKLRGGQLLKVVLFGSYARGDWVEDPVGRYFSDYDLLVVVDREELTDVPEFWEKTENRLLEELSSGDKLRTPVSVIYHSLENVNKMLELGRYFFMDIVREGVVLFEVPGYRFAESQPLSVEEALRETRDYFSEWFPGAGYSIQRSLNSIKDNQLNFAAFDLHQAVERLYHCLLLVRTLYSPKSHNLNRLRQLSEDIEPRLKAVWPRDTKFERRCFELLREAYVKARYSRNYRIATEELQWIGDRVEILRVLVEQLCHERIKTLARAA